MKSMKSKSWMGLDKQIRTGTKNISYLSESHLSQRNKLEGVKSRGVGRLVGSGHRPIGSYCLLQEQKASRIVVASIAWAFCTVGVNGNAFHNAFTPATNARTLSLFSFTPSTTGV